MNARYRPVFVGFAALIAVWLLAMGGYAISEHMKMTAEKVRAYLAQHDLNELSDEARARALRDLAAKINALSPDERRKARRDHLWDRWFAEMTDDEKGAFLDATLPSGFKQMLTSFEQLPAEKRKQTIDDAIKNLQDERDNPPGAQQKPDTTRTNQPALSEDLQKKVAMIGLKSVYSDSTAETKAELAPLLEEVQKNMESGRGFRGGH